MAVMALNVSIRFCPVPPTGKATPQKPSMLALQDEPTTPANARNHAGGVDAASIDASRLPLPQVLPGYALYAYERRVHLHMGALAGSSSDPASSSTTDSTAVEACHHEYQECVWGRGGSLDVSTELDTKSQTWTCL